MRSKEEPSQLEVHMDFCFPGDEKDGRKLIIFVARERSTRMTLSAVAPTKFSGEFLAKRVCAFSMQTCLSDLGWSASVEVRIDASAARPIAPPSRSARRNARRSSSATPRTSGLLDCATCGSTSTGDPRAKP